MDETTQIAVGADNLKKGSRYSLTISEEVVLQVISQEMEDDFKRRADMLKQQTDKINQARQSVLEAFYDPFGSAYILKDWEELDERQVLEAVTQLSEFLRLG